MGKSVYLSDDEIKLIYSLCDYWGSSGAEVDKETMNKVSPLSSKMWRLLKEIEKKK